MLVDLKSRFNWQAIMPYSLYFPPMHPAADDGKLVLSSQDLRDILDNLPLKAPSISHACKIKNSNKIN